jgi:hypothetical protein
MADDFDVNAELHRRKDVRQARMKQVADRSKPGMVLVQPGDEELRRSLKHYPSNIGFDLATGAPAEWPLDQFTQRRLRDGSVKIAQPAPEEDEMQRSAAKKSQPAEKSK